MKKKYGMIYLKSTNVHLVKDMGMIPFKLYKNYGYDSTLITFKNGDFTYQNNVVKGLKLEFVKNRFNSYTLDGSLYLLKNSNKYDILQMFHVTLSSVVYSNIYKLLNRKGKLYLKLDCSYKLPERIRGLNKFKMMFLNSFFKKFDIISVEEEQLYDELIGLVPALKKKLFILPNGVDFSFLESMNLKYDYSKKENIILNIARVGAEEKNTSMLLNAFKNIDSELRSKWKLRLVGPIEEGFMDYYNKFISENSELKDQIELVGNIDDRKKLYEEYEKAKIFTLTSNFESFGIAFIEAGAFGDVIVSTNVGIAYEIVKDNNGALVNIGDEEALTKELSNHMQCSDLEEKSNKTYNIIREKFNWDKIIENLNDKFDSIFLREEEK